MRTPARLLYAAAIVGLVLGASAGCGGSEKKKAPDAAFTHRDSALTLGPGDVRIVSTDSSIELALVGNRVVMRFGDRTMAEIRSKLDTSTVHDSGFGGSIERLVKSTVSRAVDQQVEYPVSSVREARYENGRIVLETDDGKALFDQTKINKRMVMESFAPEDAQRFVAAVQARKAPAI